MRERERERERGGERERDQYKMYFNDLNEDKFSLLSFTFQIEVQQLFVYYMYISFHMYKYLIFNFFFYKMPAKCYSSVSFLVYTMLKALAKKTFQVLVHL